MKSILKIAVALVLIAAIALWYLASNIDGLVKQIIEDVGTETLATEVILGDVKIDLGSESAAALQDLTIANPPGWQEPYVFELGTVGATIEAASLSKDVIVIPKVLVEDARLTFEQKGGESNLQSLLIIMDSAGSETVDSGDATTEGESSLLAIGEVRLANVGVTAISDQLEKPIEFALTEVVVRDIGSVENGVTPEQAAEQIVGPLVDAALKQSKEQVKQIVEQKVRAELDRKKEEATEDLKKSLRDKLRP